MNDGNRSTPVALPRDQPVTQPVVLCLLARALFLQELDRFFDGVSLGKSIQLSGVDHDAIADGRDKTLGRVFLAGVNHHSDLDTHSLGKLNVSLIMCGHAHDGAGSVVSEHVVGNPDWQSLSV